MECVQQRDTVPCFDPVYVGVLVVLAPIEGPNYAA